MKKTYYGTNAGPGPQIVNIFIEYPLEPGRRPRTRRLLHRSRHSPDGFQWGYYGSGPADLALAILWDYTGLEPEPKLYQKFKNDLIAKAGQQLRIEGGEIDQWLRAQK